MSKLYELQEQLVKIDDVLEAATDPETQEILESAREDLLATIDGKIEDILNYIADCKAKADQLRVETVRLIAKRTSLDKKVDYLKNMIMWFMKNNNIKKESYGNYDVTISKTPDKVVLDIDEESLPSWCKKITYTADKTVLKNQMIDGKAFIEGEDGQPLMIAHIESGETIRIK